MKLITFMAVFAFLLTACVYAQKPGYTISGTINGLPDGITFYLIQDKENGDADTISHIKSENGHFMFKGALNEDGQVAFVKMDTSVVKITSNKLEGKSKKMKQSWVRLMLDNSGSVIHLKGELKDWPEVKIEGSKLTEELKHYYEASRSFIRALAEEINIKIQAAMSLKDRDKAASLKREYSEAYIKNLNNVSSGSYIVPFLLYSNSTLVHEAIDVSYQELTDKQKNSFYGKRLERRVAGFRASKAIGIGKVIPDFDIKSPAGEQASIRQLALKAKYTLVDFWASWCAPCRADIPDMKKVYSAFHSKGFNIVSVSTDSSEGSWQKALKEENTPWTNGMQQGKVDKDIFGLFAIPGYILLNEKAEIIQMDLNSNFFGPKSVAIMNEGAYKGAEVFIKDKKGLRGDDLYEVMKGLLGEPGGNK